MKNNLFSSELSGSRAECATTGTENWASFTSAAQYPRPTPGWNKHRDKPTEDMSECGSEWQIKEPELPDCTAYILRPVPLTCSPILSLVGIWSGMDTKVSQASSLPSWGSSLA